MLPVTTENAHSQQIITVRTLSKGEVFQWLQEDGLLPGQDYTTYKEH